MKWRDMSSTIYASKKCKRTTAEKDDDSDIEDDFVGEPELDASADEGDEQSDSEESDEQNHSRSVRINDFQGESFDIGQTIDLESKDLADVLAEKDLLPRKAITKKTQPCVAAPEKVLSEEHWEMWSIYIVALKYNVHVRAFERYPGLYGLLHADISGGGYPHHPPVNICG